MRVLLVKMSSLGDVVHTLPAVRDAVRQGAHIDWVVEEAYEPVAALARGVHAILPVAIRRWRCQPLRSLGEIRGACQHLRKGRYDLVLDAQGLIKSALVGLLARGTVRAGFDRTSIRERAATLAYRRRVQVPRHAHAAMRLRTLFAQAMDYEVPTGTPHFGIANGRATRDHAVLLHGAAWSTKLWPERHWIDVARRAAAEGLTPTLLWQDSLERTRAERIADAEPRAEVCERMDLTGAIDLLGSSRLVVGVDTGLAHLGAAMGRPTVMLFGPTDPARTGCLGERAVNLNSELPCAPCLSRRCRHPDALATSRPLPPCLAGVAPEAVWRLASAAMQRERSG